MKSKIITPFFLKFLATLLIAFTYFNIVIAQTRPPQNIRRVTVTSKYEIENGLRTGKLWPVYQEIYDSLGRLHTEIDWDFNDHYPHNYIWHTFDGKLRVKTEIFEYEKLQKIKEFSYNKDSLISQEIVKKVKTGDTLTYFILQYKYNQSKKPVQIDAKTPDAKLAYTIKFTYDFKGTELSRKVKLNKGFVPLDSIIMIISKPRYDSKGNIIGNLVTITKADKKRFVEDYNYTYDNMNNITEILINNEKEKLIRKEERIYVPNKYRLEQIKYYNASGTLVKWIEFRYEIYRTKDIRVREIDG